MQANKIILMNLESRAIDLKACGYSFNDIANILSQETKQKISKSCVFRFFESQETAKLQAVSKSDKLQAMQAEQAINILEEQRWNLNKLRGIVENPDTPEHIKVQALKVHADEAFNIAMANKKLDPAVLVNNFTQNNIQVPQITLKEKLRAYEEAGVFEEEE